jgi:acetone carboxylase gamma subunit
MSKTALQEPVETTSEAGGGVGDAFILRHGSDGQPRVHCVECDHHYGPAQRDPKLAAVMSERSIADLSDFNAEGMVERLVARHYFCPGCGLLFAVNVQQCGDPVMLEWSLDPTAPGAR